MKSTLFGIKNRVGTLEEKTDGFAGTIKVTIPSKAHTGGNDF